MKSRIQIPAGIGMMLLVALSMPAAGPAAPAKSFPTAAQLTNNYAVPQSVFVAPASPQQGRDPFFPNSTRLSAGPPRLIPSSAHVNVTLVLNGLSGTPEHRLAMINGRTMAEGEEPELLTSAGRIKVRCVQIKADSVIVDVGGERRELRLRDQ